MKKFFELTGKPEAKAKNERGSAYYRRQLQKEHDAIDKFLKQSDEEFDHLMRDAKTLKF